MMVSVSNHEGDDFLMNMFTVRVSAPGQRVHSAFVRYTHEELDKGLMPGLTLVNAMRRANSQVSR